MKKVVSVVLCIALAVSLLAGCAAAPVQSGQNETGNNTADPNTGFNQNDISSEVIRANNLFALELFKQLNKEDREKNIFISPLSISTALTMTYQGAATTTKDAIAKALGYRGIKDDELNKSYQNLIVFLQSLDDKVNLNISNSIWVREGEEVKQDFLNTNENIFQATVKALDFNNNAAAEQINQWISDATNKKINKMVEAPIPQDVIMYLINAIYFKGDWAEQFDPKNSFQSQFNGENGKKNEVMMMSRTGKIEYGQGDGYQAVRLPYGSGKLGMYCILPGDDIPINSFITSLDAERWQEILNSLAERDEVLLQIPRFKLEYGIKNLKESLTALGMGEAFQEKADFSRIRDDVYIGRVLHKALIEVNEEGSEAAAATVVEMKLTAMLENPVFIADRSFLFVIADQETGTILFMGKLAEVR